MGFDEAKAVEVVMSEPAFPVEHSGLKHGLTKREYAAIAAMQGLLASDTEATCISGGLKAVAEHYSKCAVAYADALILELGKPAELEKKP